MNPLYYIASNIKVGSLLLILLSVFVVVQVQGQILDDSTKNVYGPKTTRFYTEEDVLYNSTVQRTIDTSDIQIHQTPFWFKKSELNPHQDLGIWATATRPWYLQAPTELGVRSGFDAFSRYALRNDQVHYYDTKSPFSELFYAQNRKGQQLFKSTFSRSINKNANIGFNFNRYGSIPQVGTSRTKTNFADNYIATIFSSYQSKTGRYKALANYRYFRNQQNEFGGIYLDSGTVLNEALFDSLGVGVNLSSVKVLDKRNEWHFYNQFSVIDSSEKIQIFYSYDRSRQINYYYDKSSRTARSDIGGNSNASFYAPFVLDSLVNKYYLNADTTFDSTRFAVNTHKGGIKGKIGGFYYQLYMKQRRYSSKRYFINYLIDDTLVRAVENYQGVYLSQHVLKDKVKLFVSGEYENASNRQFQAGIHSTWADITWNNSITYPTRLQSNYSGNYFRWNNQSAFKNPEYNVVSAKIKAKGKWFLIQPFVELTNVTNHIYFDTLARPTQYNGSIQTTAFGSLISLRLGRIHLVEYAKSYEVTKGIDVIRAPKLFSYTQLYYQSKELADRTMQFQIGVDVYYKSESTPMAYMPINQQFHIQNSYIEPDYVWADAFMNFRIRTAKVYIRVPHVTQNLIRTSYSPTPGYLATRRTFEIGFSWQFYN